MKFPAIAVLLGLAAIPALAQRPAPTINTETPEGILLQLIGQESDEAKKITLMEEFISRYAAHNGVPWVHGQMIASYTKAGQFDKAMAAAETLLATYPLDAEAAHGALKAAEGKKDPDAVLKWAVRTSEAARKAAAAPKAGDEEDEDYKRRVDYDKQVDTYTEYSLFATALQTADPAKKAQLFRALEERAPQSQYMAQSYGPYFLALSQAGDTAGATGVAERAIAKDSAIEEMLAFVGDVYLRENREPDKVLAYSTRLVDQVSVKAKPEGVSDADWQKWKSQLLGLGFWLQGGVYSAQNKFPEAEKALGAALPHLAGNDEIRAAALFHLGVASFKLGKIAEAMKFTEQCVAIKSAYQAMAQSNLKAIKAQYRVVK
jgi:tetratricopeptide (TPR) repeat protein